MLRGGDKTLDLKGNAQYNAGAAGHPTGGVALDFVVKKEEFNWAEIIKPLVEVLSGQAHNKQLQETLSLLLQYQLSSQQRLSQGLAKVIAEFYNSRFLLYLQLEASKPRNIFTLFERELDPRQLAWQDTLNFIQACHHLQGELPQTRIRREEILTQCINNLTAMIQGNSFNNADREKMNRVIGFLNKAIKDEQ